MKLIMENWKKFISEDTLEEMGAPASNPNLISAKAGIRQDLNKVKNDPENKLKAFLTKYADLEIENGELARVTPKTPYAGYNELSEENQKKYVNAVSTAVNNLLNQYWDQINQIYNLSDTAKTDIPNPEEAEAAAPSGEPSGEKGESPTGPKTGAEGEISISRSRPEIDGALEELKKDLEIFNEDPSKNLNAFLKKYTNEVKNAGDVIDFRVAPPYDYLMADDDEKYEKAIDVALRTIIDKHKDLFDKYINDINNPETAADAEEFEVDPDVELEDKETVKVDGREYTYTDDDIQELIKAYKNFIGEGDGDDGSQGLMKVKTLRQQEQLWIDLRNALNNIGKFRPIANLERALATESINIHEADNTQKAKILIRDLERLRKDLNDTDSTLNGYIGKASEGRYEAAAYMARFLAELKDVQNSIGKTIEDTKNFVGVEPKQENLNEAEEESREDKIQNVRNVFENIKDLLRSLPEIERTTSANYEEISGNIKSSYDELMKIRKYFRNVGAFAKTSEMDVDEIKEKYINIRKDLTKSMSRFIEDLRKGDIDKTTAANFMVRLAAVGNFIQETFGVGPDEDYGYKTIEVPSDETSKKEIAKTTSAEPKPSLGSKIIDLGLKFVGDRFSKSRSDNLDKSAEKVPPDAEDLEIVDDEEPEDKSEPEADTGPRPDDITDINVMTDFVFDTNSDYFKPSEMDRIFGGENAGAFKGIRRLLLILLYSKILQDRDEASVDIPINDETLQEKEEPDDNRLKRLGQEAGYKPIVIDNFLNFINGKEYKYSEDGVGKKMLYSDVLSFITRISDENLRILFNKLKQVEDDLKQANVAFNVDSSKIKEQIRKLMDGRFGKKLAESKKYNNLLERLIKQELKVLNGKKMVRN